MRALILIPLLALAACSGENLGWNPNYRAHATDYGNYLRTREAALTGEREMTRVIPVARPVQAPTAAQIAGPSPVQIVKRETTRLARTTGAAGQRQVVQRPLGAPAVDPTPATHFPQVSPSAPAASAAAPVTAATLLVRYAAANRHAPGTRVWPRSGPANPAACRSYADPAAAQTEFILRGGPTRDPLGLDPDGDGYVCGWLPEPYRPS
ncbi:hypothetical protein [uncultured Paracoccus sp.]|uniref:hypothetical protein n=1 Tax=uncultured Paracoccus sp. TaxID=189685 RepID=UPI00261D6802|nr:hypothetical protein [uncultured Paracoccus sp.]